jgi:RHS repeat-associated protein
LINDVVNINGTNYSTKYGYDSYSRLDTLTYPSTFAIRYVYNNFGYLHIVQKKSDGVMIWDATSMNSFNQYTQYYSGNSLTTTKTYDCLGMLRGIDTRYQTSIVQNLSYSFDEETGNLISRRDNRRNLTEIFSYDNLGRLREVSGPAPLSMDFANNGNITSKTSVGDYSYGSKPHAVTGVTNPDGLISSNDQRITYTTFNKVDSIIQSNYKYDLQYGYQDQRTISKLMNGSGVVQKTIYYAGPYEKEVVGSTTKEFHYIYGGDGLAAILKRQSGTDTMYYVHKDHLGSFDKVTNSTGTVVDSMSFDAWGRRRNPATWTYSNIPATKFSRGYTGHEHLEQFGLINMNGRMYDPILGRFLSTDPFVANPFSSQAFNRYSYVLNNPLKYTDPTGYYKRLDDPPASIEHSPYHNSDAGDINFGLFGEPAFGSLTGNWFNAYTKLLCQGYTGGITSFLRQFDNGVTAPNFTGTVTISSIYRMWITDNPGEDVTAHAIVHKYTFSISSNGVSLPKVPNWLDNADDALVTAGTLIRGSGELVQVDALIASKINRFVSAIQRQNFLVGKTIANTGRIIGKASTGLMIGVTAYQFISGNDNTSTWVDIGATGLTLGAAAIFGVAAAPVIAVGAFGYAVFSISGGSEWINENWGYKPVNK